MFLKIGAACLAGLPLLCQLPPGGALPPGFGPRVGQPEPAKPKPRASQPPPAQAGQPSAPGRSTAAPGQQNADQLAAEQANIPSTLPTTPRTGALNLQNASLVEVIDVLARQLKLNYILDPRVKGGVTINTYGETKDLDSRNLLDLMLRINGAAMVKSGEIWRIVPLADVMRMPLTPEVNVKEIPDATDAPMLNLVFLKYATVDELAKLLDPFIGEGGRTIAYPPANLLLIQDSRRNMARLMDLIAQFDSEQFTGQRIHLFELKQTRPSDLAKELENIYKGISLSEKSSPVKFIPIDRINVLIAVAANPGVFDSVGTWIKKFDIAVQSTAGAVENYVYRVRYGQAEVLAYSIMGLYLGYGGYGMGGYGMGGYGMGGYGMGGYGMGGYGMGGYGGGGYGMGGYGMGGYGGGGYGMGGYGGGGMGFRGGYGGAVLPGLTPTYQPNQGITGGAVGASLGMQAAPTVAAAGTPIAGQNQTGQYLQGTTTAPPPNIPRIMPNPLDNTLLIQATPQDYAAILKLLRSLDIPPRQVLIEAKVYELSLTGSLSAGLEAYLQAKNCTGSGCASLPTNLLSGVINGNGLGLTIGALVGQSRELLAILNTGEVASRSKVISAPIVVATDSIPASINVGTEVPTLTGQAVTGFQQSGNSLFAQNIQNRNTGVTLNIMARVNASGIITMVINQEVSAPQQPTSGSAIQSPSFSKRNVQTQVTVQDGDTVAIGGIIDEQQTFQSSGVPGLSRLPFVGWVFGSHTYGKSRTELIVFLTPRVIYDTAEITEATNELKSRMKHLSHSIQE